MPQSNVFSPPFNDQLAPVLTFATLPASYPVGQPVFVSNIGVGGSAWYSNGTLWKPVGGQVLLSSLDAAITGLTNSEVISHQYLIPAALLQVGDRIEVKTGLSKSGTTDTGALRIRVGTAGTTADAAIVNATVMSAAQQHAGLAHEFRVQSATAVRLITRSDLGWGGSTTASVPADITIANISNALYVDVSAISGSTNNTVGLVDVQIRLIPKAGNA
jgi:hypothetical protein